MSSSVLATHFRPSDQTDCSAYSEKTHNLGWFRFVQPKASMLAVFRDNAGFRDKDQGESAKNRGSAKQSKRKKSSSSKGRAILGSIVNSPNVHLSFQKAFSKLRRKPGRPKSKKKLVVEDSENRDEVEENIETEEFRTPAISTTESCTQTSKDDFQIYQDQAWNEFEKAILQAETQMERSHSRAIPEDIVEKDVRSTVQKIRKTSEVESLANDSMCTNNRDVSPEASIFENGKTIRSTSSHSLVHNNIEDAVMVIDSNEHIEIDSILEHPGNYHNTIVDYVEVYDSRIKYSYYKFIEERMLAKFPQWQNIFSFEEDDKMIDTGDEFDLPKVDEFGVDICYVEVYDFRCKQAYFESVKERMFLKFPSWKNIFEPDANVNTDESEFFDARAPPLSSETEAQHNVDKCKVECSVGAVETTRMLSAFRTRSDHRSGIRCQKPIFFYRKFFYILAVICSVFLGVGDNTIFPQLKLLTPFQSVAEDYEPPDFLVEEPPHVLTTVAAVTTMPKVMFENLKDQQTLKLGTILNVVGQLNGSIQPYTRLCLQVYTVGNERMGSRCQMVPPVEDSAKQLIMGFLVGRQTRLGKIQIRLVLVHPRGKIGSSSVNIYVIE